MAYWQLLIITGIIFIIIEMFAPMFFFFNIALACFLTALLALFITDWNILVPVFVVFSIVFIIFLRPILIRNRENGQKTGVEEKYIGKVAKVTQTVTASSGVINIYNERWEARSNLGEEIPEGSEVKIIRNESLILFVEKIY